MTNGSSTTITRGKQLKPIIVCEVTTPNNEHYIIPKWYMIMQGFLLRLIGKREDK